MGRKKGQSILEYVIVLTVIVAAIAYGAATFLKPTIQNGVNNSAKSIDASTIRLPGTNYTANTTP
jgi:hypothetical protein